MTRQQEGDEAMKCSKCGHPVVKIKTSVTKTGYLHDPSGYDIAMSVRLGCFDAPKPATVQPEDETTLPAPDAKCACGGSIEAIRSVHSYDECVNMDCYAPRIQMEAVLQALEAERDALKAENEELKEATSMKNTFWGQYKVQKERADSLQSQLDAVVGQETPREIWERGYRLGRFIARTEGAVKSDSVPPYTPPLKAGQ